VTDHRPPPPGRARRQLPPPPGTENRRKHARYALLAQVELDSRDGDVTLLEIGNLSLGGLFVLGEEGFTLAAGERVEVFLDLDDGIELRAPAEVVRTTEAGIAMMWVSRDPAVASSLATLLEHIRSVAD
jgi:hypothetical protein